MGCQGDASERTENTLDQTAHCGPCMFIAGLAGLELMKIAQ